VMARGLGPAEVQAAVLDRVSRVEPGAVARLYVEEVDPEAWRLVDMDAVRAAGAAALNMKLEPRFADATSFVELPELHAMPARWDSYLADQDLTGFDRRRLTEMGHQYLARAVEAVEQSC
jgi:hypothetical protein